MKILPVIRYIITLVGLATLMITGIQEMIAPWSESTFRNVLILVGFCALIAPILPKK